MEWWGVLTELEAVQRRERGLDIVVRGPNEVVNGEKPGRSRPRSVQTLSVSRRNPTAVVAALSAGKSFPLRTFVLRDHRRKAKRRKS